MHLAKLMQPGVRASQEQVIAALTAEVREHHRFEAPKSCSRSLMPRIVPLSLWNGKLTGIYPLLRSKCDAAKRSTESADRSCMCFLAEIATDLSRVPDAEHLSSWAG